MCAASVAVYHSPSYTIIHGTRPRSCITGRIPTGQEERDYYRIYADGRSVTPIGHMYEEVFVEGV